MAFVDDFGEFLLRQVVDPNATTGYLRSLRDTPFIGATNAKKVNKDFAENRKLVDILRQDTEETVGLLPSYEEFRLSVLPFFTEEAGKARNYKVGSARQTFDVNESLAAAGLVRPRGTMIRGAEDKPVFGESVADLLSRGRVEDAIRAEYSALQNVARVTPSSMIRISKELGEPLFYPLRGERNMTYAARTGLPKDIIDLGSSIASQKAGPYVESNRLLAALPFLRVNRNGDVVFDEDGFIKVYGKAAYSGPAARELRIELARAIADPNFLGRTILGISDKTAPYNMMAMVPNSQTAYVNDSIMESILTGADSGGLPGNAMTSMYGQIPGRALARILGVSPSMVQAPGWSTARVLKGEATSTVPFERNITDAMLDDVLTGRVGNNPNSINPNAAETKEISSRLQKYLGGRGQLVDPEVVALANEVRVPRNLESGLSVRDVEFEGRPVRVVTPEDTIENAMSASSRKFADRYKAAMEAVNNLGPRPDPRAVAVILAAFGIPLTALTTGGNGRKDNVT